MYYRSLESGVLKIEKMHSTIYSASVYCFSRLALCCFSTQASSFISKTKNLLCQHVHISLFEKLRRKWQRENEIGRQQRALLKDSSGISQKDQ